MYQYDDPSCAASLPIPAPSGTGGYFTNGSAAGGQPATILTADFMNMLMEELLNVVTGAGLTPSKTNYTQLLTAIKSLATAAPVVGTVRNARMYLDAASVAGTYTADEVVVESALGGKSYKVASISNVINLTATGVGGMDTGTAPVSGFVGIYLIYNPTTQASALLAANAATLLANVYGGSNMPAGYTASALVAVLATNSSSQMKPFILRDRKVSIATSNAISTGTAAATPTALSISALVPANAVTVCGGIGLNNATTSNMYGEVLVEPVSSLGVQGVSASGNNISGNFEADMTNAQVIYYVFSSSAGSPTFVITVTAYRF